MSGKKLIWLGNDISPLFGSRPSGRKPLQQRAKVKRSVGESYGDADAANFNDYTEPQVAKDLRVYDALKRGYFAACEAVIDDDELSADEKLDRVRELLKNLETLKPAKSKSFDESRLARRRTSGSGQKIKDGKSFAEALLGRSLSDAVPLHENKRPVKRRSYTPADDITDGESFARYLLRD